MRKAVFQITGSLHEVQVLGRREVPDSHGIPHRQCNIGGSMLEAWHISCTADQVEGPVHLLREVSTGSEKEI